MLQVVVNNTAPRSETEFRERILLKMKKQIRKKIIGQEEGNSIKHSCDAPFIDNKSIRQ